MLNNMNCLTPIHVKIPHSSIVCYIYVCLVIVYPHWVLVCNLTTLLLCFYLVFASGLLYSALSY